MTQTAVPRMAAGAHPWLSAFDSVLKARPFRPRRWLGNAHLQTLVTTRMKRNFDWGWSRCEECWIRLEDGSQVRAVCVVAGPEAPTLIAVHGMAGSSNSTYMQGLSHKAYREGWNTVLLNLYNRNLTQIPPQIFHAGASRELGEIVGQLVQTLGAGGDLVLVGVSMGANMLLKMLGEWGSELPFRVRAVAMMSPLVDLTSSWQLMEKFSNRIYQVHFVGSLKQLVRSRESYWKGFVDVSSVLKVRTIREFDEAFTAPVCGFRDADDYYRQASAAPLLGRIRVPTLIIHSADDPFLPWQPFGHRSVLESPNLLVELTPRGGHVGFLEQDRHQDIDRLWAENRMIDYFRLVLSGQSLAKGGYS